MTKDFIFQGHTRPTEKYSVTEFSDGRAAIFCGKDHFMTITDAARDVLAERKRQVEAEGWTPEHDDQHTNGEMAQAAACYAAYDEDAGPRHSEHVLRMWPWADEWLKLSDRRRNLVKAGALILAEIERIDRLTETSK